MLTIRDSDALCSRRQLLSIGSLTLGGLSLTTSLAARAEASSLLTGKSVIFLFQQGGPSQFETFDPKIDASSDIRTVTDSIPTSVSGVHFGESFPQLAQLAHRLAVVRSFQTGNVNHNIQPLVGRETKNANLGAYYSRVAGPTHPQTAMPSSAVLFPQSVCTDVTKGEGRGDLLATGNVGGAYAPFTPGGASQLLRDMQLNTSPDRLQDRRQLHAQLDQLGQRLETDAQFELLDKQQQQACDVLLSGAVAQALDLAQEDPGIVAQYDTAHFAGAKFTRNVLRVKRGYYSGHAKSLGKCLLLARRLCEAGCGFVTVHCAYEGVWDMHADAQNLDMQEGMRSVGGAFDHAVAAFIRDVESRGLSNKILLVATGEMGRTPRINKDGGRDHWAKLAPLMLYGGGIAPGTVIGQSTRDGSEPVADPLTSRNLISTILHTVFDIPQLRLHPALNPISQLAEPAIIPGLL